MFDLFLDDGMTFDFYDVPKHANLKSFMTFDPATPVLDF